MEAKSEGEKVSASRRFQMAGEWAEEGKGGSGWKEAEAE
jgi:hypothetical protein